MRAVCRIVRFDVWTIPFREPCNTGSCTTNHYHMSMGEQAHRLVWIQAYGPIPEGYEIDHVCGRKACTVLSHLEAVTHKENCRRRPNARSLAAKGRERW